MSKTAKAITFVVISFVIFMVAAALKQSGVGAVMWIAIMAEGVR